MICNSTEEAIETAAAHVIAGHRVAFICGKRECAPDFLEAIAKRVPGATYEGFRVRMNGREVVYPRHPFTPGSGLHGHIGAVVCDPSIRRDIYSDGELRLMEIVRDCHRRAGISA